jgi:heme a synthase
MPAVARYAWAVLSYNLAVIAWGAYVRATGSGAGCGEHWPLCNGAVIPRAPAIATIVEFSHRLTSGLALLAVVGLVIWTFRARGRGDQARTGAVLSLVFILTEAAVGAGLVLFQLVADNASMARGLFMAVHLLNTFILLSALTFTAWSLSGGGRLERVAARKWTMALAGCAALLVAGASGAVAALGDTLFPAATLTEALSRDLSASSHLLIRLRIFHPFLAVAAGLAVVALGSRLATGSRPPAVRMARALTVLVATQIAWGIGNVALLAPVWMQLGHLLIADAIWISFLVVSFDALSSGLQIEELKNSRIEEGENSRLQELKT